MATAKTKRDGARDEIVRRAINQVAKQKAKRNPGTPYKVIPAAEPEWLSLTGEQLVELATGN